MKLSDCLLFSLTGLVSSSSGVPGTIFVASVLSRRYFLTIIMTATGSASNNGTPTPAPTPTIWLVVSTVEVASVTESSRVVSLAKPRRIVQPDIVMVPSPLLFMLGSCDGRRTSALPPSITNVSALEHELLYGSQTNVLRCGEQGWRATPPPTNAANVVSDLPCAIHRRVAIFSVFADACATRAPVFVCTAPSTDYAVPEAKTIA